MMKQPAKPYFRICLFILFSYNACPAFAQSADSLGRDNNLFSAGHAGGFVGGLYDAFYPYKQLEQKGDFGLGAPANLDGELMMLNGKYYQTRYTGITTQLADTGKTPYATVCFFRPGKVIHVKDKLTKAQLFKLLDSVLNNQNGMYAIHISGNFKYVKTRAFPPVTQRPYTPIAAMLDKQQFFEFNALQGDLIGFKLPEFLAGPAISGYHFHFLSADKVKGGHMTDLITGDITIEIETLNSFTLNVPQTTDFRNYNFKNNNAADIKSVENGKK